jgi:rRNA maturation RNase YbeY
MINFNYETSFELGDEDQYSLWVSSIIDTESKVEGTINYIFCDDSYLLKINEEYLKHDTLTDIISFDYSIGKELHGDIFISIERVRENAVDYRVEFTEELNRVMAHGILHYCGYNDKNKEDELVMRLKEEEKMSMFHVKHS